MPDVTTIAADRVVFMHYTLKNGDGEVLDSSQGAEPLFYLHGHGNIVPGLEAALTGKDVGESLSVTVEAKDGYGERLDEEAQRIRRREFPNDFEIFEGRQLLVEDNEGQPVPLWISKVEGAWVWVSRNHPLAGQDLHFDVEITRVREATQVEIDHGHPHGPEGTTHHH